MPTSMTATSTSYRGEIQECGGGQDLEFGRWPVAARRPCRQRRDDLVEQRDEVGDGDRLAIDLDPLAV